MRICTTLQSFTGLVQAPNVVALPYDGFPRAKVTNRTLKPFVPIAYFASAFRAQAMQVNTLGSKRRRPSAISSSQTTQ